LKTDDYAFLFKPNLPFMKKSRQKAPFFGLNDRMPVVLALLLGLQHSLAMLAGIITPPIIIAGSANFDSSTTQYLVSTSLVSPVKSPSTSPRSSNSLSQIVCGILSAIQITRFRIYGTPYYIGTGLISVVGTSFSTIPIATGALAQMYDYVQQQQMEQNSRVQKDMAASLAQHHSAPWLKSACHS
jgi:xanthine/uracil permease